MFDAKQRAAGSTACHCPVACQRRPRLRFLDGNVDAADQASSMRWKAFRFAPESTMAIHISVPILGALAGGLMACSASAIVTCMIFNSLGCFSLPWMRPHRTLKQALALHAESVIEKETRSQRLGDVLTEKVDQLFRTCSSSWLHCINGGCSGIRRA